MTPEELDAIRLRNNISTGLTNGGDVGGITTLPGCIDVALQ